jgi:predicted acylesterase/phospholipase RssA
MPGAGTAGGVIVGAVKELSTVFSWTAFAGTSFGGLMALFMATVKTADAAINLVGGILQRKDLLDKGMPWDGLGKPGLFRGNVIEKIMKDTFGEKLKMGDLKYPARVGVAALGIGRSALVDSVRHADVLVWRAARSTMAIEFFFDPARLRADNARTYGDGGLGLNVPFGAWDDRPEMTVGLRFSHHEKNTLENLLFNADGDAHYKSYERVDTYPDLLRASFNVSMATAAASFPSKKTGDRFFEVVLESDADGMKFGLSHAEAAVRVQSGILSGRRALARWTPPKLPRN